MNQYIDKLFFHTRIDSACITIVRGHCTVYRRSCMQTQTRRLPAGSDALSRLFVRHNPGFGNELVWRYGTCYSIFHN